MLLLQGLALRISLILQGLYNAIHGMKQNQEGEVIVDKYSTVIAVKLVKFFRKEREAIKAGDGDGCIDQVNINQYAFCISIIQMKKYSVL